MKKSLIVLVLCFLLSIFAVSCEQSDIALAEIIRTSQPREDIRWKEAYIIKNKSDATKVDAAVLVSALGVHVFKSEGDSPKNIKTPTIPNDGKSGAEGNGIFSRVFIPAGYNSDSNRKIILESIPSVPHVGSKYFSLDLSDNSLDEIEFVKPTEDYDPDFSFKLSSTLNSDMVFYRTTSGSNYTYHLAKFKLTSETEFTFDSPVKSFTDPKTNNRDINRVWEGKDNKYAVVMYNERIENDSKKTCKYAVVNLDEGKFVMNDAGTYEKYDSLNTDGTSDRNLHFDHFIVYDDGKWMGITKTGIIYHSDIGDDYKTKDAYSFYRFAPVALLDTQSETGDTNVYGATLFGRYTGNGFIVTRFLKEPKDQHVIADYSISGTSYRNSYIINTGFSEKLRAEEISAFAYIHSSSEAGYTDTLLVLTVEVGISSYLFSSTIPSKLTGSSGKEFRDAVRLDFN